MIDHVSLTVADLDRAERFYDAIMAALGYPKVKRLPDSIGYGRRRTADDFGEAYISIVTQPTVSADRRHWAFIATSRAAVDGFHAAALGAGGGNDGTPGPRSGYHPHYYAAFVRDPDGNRLEAVRHRRAERQPAWSIASAGAARATTRLRPSSFAA